jgi:transcriptional pleiotropic regulator of transition state genes
MIYWLGGMRMKATGIVRKVDELGRIVLPIELRRTLNIEIKDPIEIYVDGDYILLKKYEPACIFCGNAKAVKRIHDKNVCADCIKEMQEL